MCPDLLEFLRKWLLISVQRAKTCLNRTISRSRYDLVEARLKHGSPKINRAIINFWCVRRNRTTSWQYCDHMETRPKVSITFSLVNRSLHYQIKGSIEPIHGSACSDVRKYKLQSMDVLKLSNSLSF